MGSYLAGPMTELTPKILARRIGEHARQTRQALGWSQAEVAEAARLATEVYGRLERGGMLPSVPTLMRLVGALGLTPNDLLGDAPPKKPRGGTGRRRTLQALVRRLEQTSDSDLRRVRVIVAAFLGAHRRNSGRTPGRQAEPKLGSGVRCVHHDRGTEFDRKISFWRADSG